MRQLTQTLKDGTMAVLDVPFPALPDGAVLVRCSFSLISAGTEGKTVKEARLGYVAKARARQKEVRQVVQSVKTKGLAPTYKLVMNKLEAPSALGYSCAGEVIAVGDAVTDLKVGDRVACGGGSAVHAEVVAVPRNLCVRVPDGVDLREAAFTTLAAIALQGIRQAEVALGANAAVIGLGLVGLLTVKLLRAAGVRAIGVDLDPAQVALGREAGALAFERNHPGLEAAVLDATRGAGADAVIITAGTASLDPVELAGRLCRPKGHVVIVGNVPTGFSREHYYRKELDLRMSCSYGPGRYDARYEEEGVDYPIGYVRWTENRNMEAFVDLLAAGRIEVASLTSHTLPLERAPEAYQMILDRSESFVGVLLAYDTERVVEERVVVAPRGNPAPTDLTLGFVGAGSFAQNVLLPALDGRGILVGVATARPNIARHVADKYGFAYCTGESDEVIADPGIKTVFVVTRHDLHAPLVLEALRHGKNVFVEKPLCLTKEQLIEIEAEYRQQDVHLMVGFNRRFAPLVDRMKQAMGGGPVAIQYRINAGTVPPTHWVHDPQVGGGRILGEFCHFVDLAMHLAGAPVTRVAATAMDDPHHLGDTVSVALEFGNGSTASIAYFSNGHSSLPKERLEVFAGGRVAVLDDFKSLEIYGDKTTRERLRRQDKGHRAEVASFLQAIESGGPTPIPFDEIACVTRATFAVVEATRTRQEIAL